MKRALDVTLVLLTAPLWFPLLLLLALLVRVRLGRPVLFKQQRPGLGGRPFTLIKLRTMTDARDGEGRLLPDADRLPSFGQWLRATSLDELPELVNVFKGDMSLVGPRPLLMEYLTRYSDEQARRHAARPGITGWAQVNGRNAVDWEDRLRLDVWYVDHETLWLDLKILWSTAAQVLRRQGITASGHVSMPKFPGNPS